MYQSTGTSVLPVALPLEEGALLGQTRVAWCAYGERSDDNVALLLHDITHSHQVLGPAGPHAYRPSGWGTALVGEGRPLDTSALHVLAPNLLGSPFGSTSPVSLDERAGVPYGAALPTLTVLDMARAVAALLRGMRIERVRVVVGVGLGGLVALQLAALFPELASAVAVLGAAKSLPESLRERHGLMRHMLRLDPDFRGGHYAAGAGPQRTLRKQYLGYLRLLHAPSLPDTAPPPEGTRWEEEAESFARTFDANAWALLCTAYAGAELTESLPRIRAPVLLATAAEDALAPPSRVRDTYHLLSAAGVRAHYHELPAPFTHADLVPQAGRLHGPLRDFLRRRG